MNKDICPVPNSNRRSNVGIHTRVLVDKRVSHKRNVLVIDHNNSNKSASTQPIRFSISLAVIFGSFEQFIHPHNNH